MGFNEIMLYANDALYDLRGVPDENQVEYDAVIDAFKAEFGDAPDKAEIYVRHHGHPMYGCECRQYDLGDTPVWTNGVTECWVPA
jgi:hypothetical protein